jgi:hypothetical protein
MIKPRKPFPREELAFSEFSVWARYLRRDDPPQFGPDIAAYFYRESTIERLSTDDAQHSIGKAVTDHFVDVNKMIELAKGAQRNVADLTLTRYACYLIAQNGDPRKDAIAFAMTYFAVQTRKQEIIETRMAEWERVQAREKLSLSQKELSRLRWVDHENNSRETARVHRCIGDKTRPPNRQRQPNPHEACQPGACTFSEWPALRLSLSSGYPADRIKLLQGCL